MELIQLENLQRGNFNIYVQSIKCARRQLSKLWPSSPFCCEDDMLVMISTWIDKGWSRLWRFILLQGLCGSKAQAGIIFMKKPPQFPASYLTNCDCIKAEAKLRLGYYGIEQNPIAELDLDRSIWSTWDIWHFHLFMIFHLRFIYNSLLLICTAVMNTERINVKVYTQMRK